MEKKIIDFQFTDEQDRWEVMNDTVMGGISSSRLSVIENKIALFQGVISLENYGGFSSMRTRPGVFDFSGYKGVMIRVKGDGKDYRLRLRTDNDHEGMAYQALFTTEQESWITVRLSFDAFIPVFRGRVVEDAPVLNLSGIRRIGFMIADKQEGHFRLEIEWVKVYA